MKMMSKVCTLLLSAVLCVGMAAPAFAYGGDTEEVELPVLTVSTNEEDTVTVTDEDSGALTPEGNLTLVDDYHTSYSDGSGQQFITLVSKSGNTFYLVIDRNSKGENTVHFMNLVDESDLLSLMDDEDAEAYTAEKEAAAQAELEQKFFDSQMMLQEDEMVSGDLQGLQQILNNILSNAIKYTKAHGKISFLARREPGNERNRVHYTFVIKDTGCGMSAKFLEKIYKPFERDSRFGVPRVTGTGLGMTIVKSLVERMDGSIHISSRVDEGTCVIISLPFNIVKKVESKPQDTMPKLKDFAGCRILVAEDNNINMEIISELLTMNGLEVLPASNGKEAVNLFESSEEGSISMVLMDMQMPVMDGFEASRAIRALPREDAHAVPILALTGNSGSDDVERAMAAGMNDFMVKPVQMKLLAQMMGAYLQH